MNKSYAYNFKLEAINNLVVALIIVLVVSFILLLFIALHKGFKNKKLFALVPVSFILLSFLGISALNQQKDNLSEETIIAEYKEVFSEYTDKHIPYLMDYYDTDKVELDLSQRISNVAFSKKTSYYVKAENKVLHVTLSNEDMWGEYKIEEKDWNDN